MKEYFTLEECMEQLGLKRSAILKRLKEGELEPVYENIPKKGRAASYFSFQRSKVY